jgi:glutamate N-acetyltransferase/amino-acid N-acetyltransferase
MEPVPGLAIGVGRAGLYKHVRNDLLILRCAPGTTAAGVFTRHSVGSAPVDWCRAALRASGGRVRAVVVNAGCANSFTGEAGARAVRAIAEATSAELGCPIAEVLTASTGVIGEPLPYGKILNVLGEVLIEVKENAWERAAEAISTTDTFAKGAEAQTKIGATPVRIAGVAKGSGMIAPNMATMLAFLATDAAIAPAALQAMLAAEMDETFNAVTVDGDRSTNDTCLLLATGRADHPAVTDPSDPAAAEFRKALRSVLLSLAQMLVRDGEGARKFVEVVVAGAASLASARKIARTICESPLVKTAIAGEDANWGRIVMAVGRADEPVVREAISIRFGEHWAARNGVKAPEYSEAALSQYMKGSMLKIEVDVGSGSHRATLWTCDLTHGYISINGDYRS